MADYKNHFPDRDKEGYTPPNPDSSGYDARDYLGTGHLYSQWLDKISEEERLKQKEMLLKYGKEVPKYDDNGTRITQQGWRLGLPWMSFSERGLASASVKRRPYTENRMASVRFDTSMQNRFIRKLSEVGNVRLAAAELGISYGTVYHHARKNEKFKERMESAKEEQVAKVYRTFMQRILEGEETIEYDGKGYVTKKTKKPVSTALLMKYLESNMPEYHKKTEHHHVHAEAPDKNAVLNQLLQKLGVDELPESKEKEIDINGEYVEKKDD